MTPTPQLERHQKHEMSRYKHVNKYPNCGTTWTAVHLFSFHSHVNQMPHIWQPGEARQICVHVLQWYTLDAHRLQATGGKSQPRLSRDSWWRSPKHLMSCNVRRLRITTERVLKFVPGMASKSCDTHISTLCPSVEHVAELACGPRYPGCIYTLCRTSNVATSRAQ